MKDCKECEIKNGCAVELCPAKLDAIFVKDGDAIEIEKRAKSTKR